MIIAVGVARYFERRLAILRRLLGAAEGIGLVIGVRIGIGGHEMHRPVLIVIMDRAFGRIDGQRFIMRADAMAMGVGIGEDARLQHLVGREPDARHDVGRRIGGLFDFREIIVGIAVELENANVDQGIILVRPHFGEAERIVGRLLRVEFGHDLHAQIPFWKLAALDRAIEIFLRGFAGAADHFGALRIGPVLVALPGLEMELHPEPLVGRIDEGIGMRAIAVHIANAGRQTAVGHQDRHLMQAFGRERPIIPHGGRRAQVGARMTLLGMDEIGEFIGIADEKHRGIIADKVPIAFLGVEFERKAAHVAFGVGGAGFAGDRRKARNHLGFLADLRENLGFRISSDVMGDGERAMRAPALGVDGALRNALSVLVRELLDAFGFVNQIERKHFGGVERVDLLFQIFGHLQKCVGIVLDVDIHVGTGVPRQELA